jgi:hypothetical protein
VIGGQGRDAVGRQRLDQLVRGLRNRLPRPELAEVRAAHVEHDAVSVRAPSSATSCRRAPSGGWRRLLRARVVVGDHKQVGTARGDSSIVYGR